MASLPTFLSQKKCCNILFTKSTKPIDFYAQVHACWFACLVAQLKSNDELYVNQLWALVLVKFFLSKNPWPLPLVLACLSMKLVAQWSLILAVAPLKLLSFL